MELKKNLSICNPNAQHEVELKAKKLLLSRERRMYNCLRSQAIELTEYLETFGPWAPRGQNLILNVHAEAMNFFHKETDASNRIVMWWRVIKYEQFNENKRYFNFCTLKYSPGK